MDMAVCRKSTSGCRQEAETSGDGRGTTLAEAADMMFARMMLVRALGTGVALVLLALVGCAHTNRTTDEASSEAVVRAVGCGLAGLLQPRGACRPDYPSEFGVTLRGQVLIDGPLGPMPASYTKISLLRQGAEIAGSATDHQGHFQFKQNLSSGPYALRVGPGDYQGELVFEIEGRAPDVVVHASRR
jgi:hypothetical protein